MYAPLRLKALTDLCTPHSYQGLLLGQKGKHIGLPVQRWDETFIANYLEMT